MPSAMPGTTAAATRRTTSAPGRRRRSSARAATATSTSGRTPTAAACRRSNHSIVISDPSGDAGVRVARRMEVVDGAEPLHPPEEIRNGDDRHPPIPCEAAKQHGVPLRHRLVELATPVRVVETEDEHPK